MHLVEVLHALERGSYAGVMEDVDVDEAVLSLHPDAVIEEHGGRALHSAPLHGGLTDSTPSDGLFYGNSSISILEINGDLSFLCPLNSQTQRRLDEFLE